MLYAFCIESSHERGMGHLFRSLCLAKELLKLKIKVLFFLNQHKPSVDYLQKEGIDYHIIKSFDKLSCFLEEYLKKYRIDVWINDRLNTKINESKIIKSFLYLFIFFAWGIIILSTAQNFI